MASKLLSRDSYMDDIASVSGTSDATKELQDQLRDMLQTRYMPLHKWSPNSNELKNSMPTKAQQFTNKNEGSVKTLGVK